ncbi:MAG: HNH endonuclease [Longimicrobiales bacterium]
MNAYVAVTDPDWFDHLSGLHAQQPVPEVNFWMPKPWGGRFGVLADGQPLLFKLKSPRNAIAGGGFYKHYTELPLSLAWEAFGERNGASDRVSVWRRITRLRREEPRPGDDPVIGCILLVEPFFWPEELWIHDPPGWQRNIQRGRGYDLRQGEGAELWDLVRDRLERSRAARAAETGEGPAPDAIPGGYGDPLFQPRRMGQGTFKAVVTDLYHRRCAITGERALPALDAAHIRPFSEVREHVVTNGLLLRSDVHRLFDAGYVTITPEYRVEASQRMRGDFNDGDNYLKLHGRAVWTPDSEGQRPDPEALRWHNERIYRG